MGSTRFALSVSALVIRVQLVSRHAYRPRVEETIGPAMHSPDGRDCGRCAEGGGGLITQPCDKMASRGEISRTQRMPIR